MNGLGSISSGIIIALLVGLTVSTGTAVLIGLGTTIFAMLISEACTCKCVDDTASRHASFTKNESKTGCLIQPNLQQIEALEKIKNNNDNRPDRCKPYTKRASPWTLTLSANSTRIAKMKTNQLSPILEDVNEAEDEDKLSITAPKNRVASPPVKTR